MNRLLTTTPHKSGKRRPQNAGQRARPNKQNTWNFQGHLQHPASAFPGLLYLSSKHQKSNIERPKSERFFCNEESTQAGASLLSTPALRRWINVFSSSIILYSPRPFPCQHATAVAYHINVLDSTLQWAESFPLTQQIDPIAYYGGHSSNKHQPSLFSPFPLI